MKSIRKVLLVSCAFVGACEGKVGPQGPDGEQGAPGRDGRDGALGADGAPGKPGPDGQAYVPPPPSCPSGTTPVEVDEELVYCLHAFSDVDGMSWFDCRTACASNGLDLVEFDNLVDVCLSDPSLLDGAHVYWGKDMNSLTTYNGWPQLSLYDGCGPVTGNPTCDLTVCGNFCDNLLGGFSRAAGSCPSWPFWNQAAAVNTPDALSSTHGPVVTDNCVVDEANPQYDCYNWDGCTEDLCPCEGATPIYYPIVCEQQDVNFECLCGRDPR